MMKKLLSYLSKCVISGIISVLILSLFSLIYYNPPLAVQQSDGITNNKFKADKKWCYMWEGFGYGTIDDIGYNNAYYQNCSEPDIVFIGSSHLEALQVPQDANCVYLLNEMFDKDDLLDNNFKCLNLGISGHFFEVSSSNFENVVNKFKDAKYIVIETSNVEFSSDKLDKILKDGFHSELQEKNFFYKVAQGVPYFRLLYKKIKDTGIIKDNEKDKNDDGKPASIQGYTEKMNTILNRISALSEANDIVPVILMHDNFKEDKNGNISFEKSEDYKEVFKKCCEKNGIKVLDVSDEMVAYYKENHQFPYGYSNTVPGKGHLNKTGHRIIAEELYKQFNEMVVR